MTDKVVVLVTCGSAAEARRIARAVVGEKLAACANILGARVQSLYRWKGKVESAKETLLIIKTTRRRLTALEKKIRALHSYDVPEFIALPIVSGSRGYLAWLTDSVRT
ncbi:MAG TPA: divalent-cation tolerance protein CutA [Candidatus Aquilonibacter sp.]|nr:divalent-cation tolerance protein CutA [Candidatus Aquilonibacter sp.]